MNEKFFKSSLNLLIKFFFCGTLFGLFFFVLYFLLNNLVTTHLVSFVLIKSNGYLLSVTFFKFKNVIFIFLLISSFLIILSNFWKDKISAKIDYYKKSERLDLLLVFILGIISVFVFKDKLFLDLLENKILGFSFLQSLFLFFLLFLVVITLSKSNDKKRKKDERDKSRFLSDNEIEKDEDDLLNFKDKAKNFAENIYDNKSKESLVFGLDAPWGTGKSSFINLCEKYLEENYKGEFIFYKFRPLKYEDKKSLLEKLIEGIIDEIQKYEFIPELDSITSKYLSFLKNTKASFSLFGFSFNLPFFNDKQDYFNKLKECLENIDKKIIVIIDDLDRLHFSEIKEVLFGIKQAFNLKNISYVLCYDTYNFNSLENENAFISNSVSHRNNNQITEELNVDLSLKQKNLDQEKVTEFLEKFVNVKYSLFLKNSSLRKWFELEFNKISSKNIDGGFAKILGKSIDDLFEENNFSKYRNFLGDIRKMKRFLNSVIMLEIALKKESNNDVYKNEYSLKNFLDTDVDYKDLLHLLLLYVYFPTTFGDIYKSEIENNEKIFSIKRELSSNNNYKYINSKDYIKYIKNNEQKENLIFLLESLFDANDVTKKLNDLRDNEKEEKFFASKACFNREGRNNLEMYLNLIVDGIFPEIKNQHQFYSNRKDEVLNSKENIILSILNNNFNNEFEHEKFWRVLVNSNHSLFTPKKSKEIIEYALNNIDQYSLIENKKRKVGFRRTFIYFIVKLLDQLGWTDKNGKVGDNNSDENVLKIANWIFGEKEYQGSGVLDILEKRAENVVGLYDLIGFRLRCCDNRGSDIFNLSRALVKHHDPNGATSGDVNLITITEMREMSQTIFKFFQENYIVNKRNILKEIDNLKIEDVCGKYFGDYDENDEEIKESLANLKNGIKIFTIFQMGSDHLGHGIGFGYYDVEGNEDKKGIKDIFNNYLFKVCFENNKFFVDFLYLCYLDTLNNAFFHEENTQEFVIKKEHLTKFFKEENLKDYWKEKGDEIKKIGLDNNYTEKDKKNINKIFDFLDSLIKQNI